MSLEKGHTQKNVNLLLFSKCSWVYFWSEGREMSLQLKRCVCLQKIFPLAQNIIMEKKKSKQKTAAKIGEEKRSNKKGGGIALGNRGDEKCIYPPPLTPFLHHLKKRWREKTLYKQLATSRYTGTLWKKMYFFISNVEKGHLLGFF